MASIDTVKKRKIKQTNSENTTSELHETGGIKHFSKELKELIKMNDSISLLNIKLTEFIIMNSLFKENSEFSSEFIEKYKNILFNNDVVFKEIYSNVKETNEKIVIINNKIEKMDEKFDKMDEKLKKIDEKIENILSLDEERTKREERHLCLLNEQFNEILSFLRVLSDDK